LGRLPSSRRVAQFSVLFLGLALSLRSYFVRELLACWLLLGLFLFSLTLVAMLTLLAVRVGLVLLHWASTARLRAPTIALTPVEISSKMISVGREPDLFSGNDW
jgi:hypothetical protein